MYLSISEKNLKPAPNSPKENSGANGKFLPKPLLFHLRLPNSKTNEPKFWQILSPKNSFAKTSSALKPHARGACEVIGFGNRCELGIIDTPKQNLTALKKPLSSVLVPLRGFEPLFFASKAKMLSVTPQGLYSLNVEMILSK